MAARPEPLMYSVPHTAPADLVRTVANRTDRATCVNRKTIACQPTDRIMGSHGKDPQADSVLSAVRTRTFRIDDETWAAVEKCAAVQELSAAEYVRRATLAQLAEDQEMAALHEDADPEEFRQVLLARMLSRAAADVQLVARAMGDAPTTSPE